MVNLVKTTPMDEWTEKAEPVYVRKIQDSPPNQSFSLSFPKYTSNFCDKVTTTAQSGLNQDDVISVQLNHSINELIYQEMRKIWPFFRSKRPKHFNDDDSEYGYESGYFGKPQESTYSSYVQNNYTRSDYFSSNRVSSEEMERYCEDFNRNCVDFFLEVINPATHSKKTIGVDENNYIIFLHRIWEIIENGSITSSYFNDIIDKSFPKDATTFMKDGSQILRNFSRNKRTIIAKGQVATERQDIHTLIALSNKSIKDFMQEVSNDIENQTKKTIIDLENASRNFLSTYIELIKRAFIKEEAEDETFTAKILNRAEKYWKRLFNEMFNTENGQLYYNYALEIAEANSFKIASNVKGQFFEDFFGRIVLPKVAAKHKIKEAEVGAMDTMSLYGANIGKALADAIFNKVGFQLKSGSSFSVDEVYAKQNRNINLKQPSNYRLLNQTDWINFATLLETQADVNGKIPFKNIGINNFLYKLEEFQLRLNINSDTYMGIDKTKEVVKNSIYLINGFFYPGSYVLYRRYKNLFDQNNQKILPYTAKGELVYEVVNKDEKGYKQNGFNLCSFNDGSTTPMEKVKNLLSKIIITRG